MKVVCLTERELRIAGILNPEDPGLVEPDAVLNCLNAATQCRKDTDTLIHILVEGDTGRDIRGPGLSLYCRMLPETHPHKCLAPGATVAPHNSLYGIVGCGIFTPQERRELVLALQVHLTSLIAFRNKLMKML